MALTREHFTKWEHDKVESITGYRDRGYSSPCTGTPAPIHHTPWWEAMNDSLETFPGTDTEVGSAYDPRLPEAGMTPVAGGARPRPAWLSARS